MLCMRCIHTLYNATEDKTVDTSLSLLAVLRFARMTSQMLSSQAVLPPWPMFNRHPVVWLPAKDTKSE